MPVFYLRDIDDKDTNIIYIEILFRKISGNQWNWNIIFKIFEIDFPDIKMLAFLYIKNL